MQDAQQANPAKLFVGNLPYSVDEDQLRDMFSAHGTVVDVNIIKHGPNAGRLAGKSKGFGFVEMDSAEAAQAAIQALHESEVDGRNMIVNVARPMEKRERRFDDRRSGGYGNRGGYGGGNRGGYNRDSAY